MLCTAYYALPLALSVACSCLAKSLISDDYRQAYISGALHGILMCLIVPLTLYLPQSPIRRWLIGTLFQERGWKWKVSLLIFPSTVVLLLTLSHLTMLLLHCRIIMHYRCDFHLARKLLLSFAITTGSSFGVLYIHH